MKRVFSYGMIRFVFLTQWALFGFLLFADVTKITLFVFFGVALVINALYMQEVAWKEFSRIFGWFDISDDDEDDDPDDPEPDEMDFEDPKDPDDSGSLLLIFLVHNVD